VAAYEKAVKLAEGKNDGSLKKYRDNLERAKKK